MGFVVGINGVFKLDNASDSLIDISSYITGIDDSDEVGVPKVTTMGKSREVYLAGGVGDGTFDLEFIWDATIDAILRHAEGRSKTYEYGPAGSTSGLPKATGEVIGKSYKVSQKAGSDAITCSISLQKTDTQTHTTWS